MGLKEDIRKTIEYSKKYKCELNPNDLIFRLISGTKYQDKDIFKYARNFQINNKLKSDHNKYAYEKKIKLARELANKIGRYRNILLIGVTGSVAAGYPEKGDDIDLLIITKRNSLWITRLKVKWYLWVNSIPQRKYGRKEKPNQFCFNIWIDESELCLPKSKQNLKNGVDLILMKPIINRNYIYTKFINENCWAKKYVINGYEKIIQKEKIRRLKTEDQKNGGILKLINYLSFLIQFNYMKPKFKKEIVNLKQAFFHPNG